MWNSEWLRCSDVATYGAIFQSSQGWINKIGFTFCPRTYDLVYDSSRIELSLVSSSRLIQNPSLKFSALISSNLLLFIVSIRDYGM
jgi:hypothetical protein